VPTRLPRPIPLPLLGAAALAATAALGAAAYAAERPHPPAPPPEAVAACAGKAAADACTVTLGDHAEQGTCATFDGAGALACRPAHPPPGGHGRPPGPPPEALEACSGLAQGAACAVTLGGDTLDGSCEPGPGGEALACRPARMPPPPGE
jgi:hypothetical protein